MCVIVALQNENLSIDIQSYAVGSANCTVGQVSGRPIARSPIQLHPELIAFDSVKLSQNLLTIIIFSRSTS